MKTLISSFLLISVSIAAQGQTIVADFTFTDSGDGHYASSDSGTNWTTSDLTPLDDSETFSFGNDVPGIDESIGNPVPAYRFYMGNINGGSNNTNPDDFVEFTVTPDAGATLDFTSLTFDFYKNSGGADVTADLSWSVDNYASSIGSGLISSLDTWEQMMNANLTSLASQTTATTFRITFATTGGTDSNDLYLDNVVLNADVTAVPEASTFALLAGCFGLTWIMSRRR